MAKAIIIVAPIDFRDEELFETRKALEKRGIKVEVASVGVKEAKGFLGGKTKVDKDVLVVYAKDYDAVIFVGGKGCEIYYDDFVALDLAKEAYNMGKVVAAICAAPTILANADLLIGRKATSYPSQKEHLEDSGCEFVHEPVVVDGSIITANGPEAAEDFGNAVADAIL